MRKSARPRPASRAPPSMSLYRTSARMSRCRTVELECPGRRPKIRPRAGTQRGTHGSTSRPPAPTTSCRPLSFSRTLPCIAPHVSREFRADPHTSHSDVFSPISWDLQPARRGTPCACARPPECALPARGRGVLRVSEKAGRRCPSRSSPGEDVPSASVSVSARGGGPRAPRRSSYHLRLTSAAGGIWTYVLAHDKAHCRCVLRAPRPAAQLILTCLRIQAWGHRLGECDTGGSMTCEHWGLGGTCRFRSTLLCSAFDRDAWPPIGRRRNGQRRCWSLRRHHRSRSEPGAGAMLLRA